MQRRLKFFHPIMSEPAFSLFVTLKFSDSQFKEDFLRDIALVATHVRNSEPDTLSYEVLLSDKDDLTVVVMERYRDKEHAFLRVHRNSQPFQEFRPKLKAMQDDGKVTISGESFLDSGIGFGDRA
jgi:quinol monooxygenase YgiN